MQGIPYNNEITALIRLLDDSDREVLDHVSDRLRSYGPGIVPVLEEAWENSVDPILHDRIEQLIENIQLNSLESDLHNWAVHHPQDLLEAALLIIRFQYPEADVDDIVKKIEKIKRAIWLELNYHLTPLEQVNVFNHVFYGIEKFKVDPDSTREARFFFINNLLESKTGNSYSTSLLYLILASKLDIPIYGVLLPDQLILACTRSFLEDEDFGSDIRGEVLFYINPLNRGAIFTRNEISKYLKKQGVEADPAYFTPAAPKEVIAFLMKELLLAYGMSEKPEKAEELRVLLDIIKFGKR